MFRERLIDEAIRWKVDAAKGREREGENGVNDSEEEGMNGW